MTARPGSVFADGTSLRNFAVIDRLALLEARFGDRLVLTETIRDELVRGLRHEDSIQRILDSPFLGPPMEIDLPIEGIMRIELIRLGLGGAGANPRQHLGEAEIIYCMEAYAPGTVFFTDDRAAQDFARNRGLATINSADVLRECFSLREIDCPEAYDLLVEMRAQGRGVHVPDHHLDVCDPMAFAAGGS